MEDNLKKNQKVEASIFFCFFDPTRKTTSTKREDDLKKNKNGRRPQFNFFWTQLEIRPQKKWKINMEDGLKKIKMEDVLEKNGRRPWKKNGRRPQKQIKKSTKINLIGCYTIVN